MYSLRRKGNVMELKEKPAAKRDIRSCDLSARHHLGKGREGERKQISKQDSSLKEAG